MTDPSHLLHDLEAAITEDVTRALSEDVRGGDLTASLVPEKTRGHARVISREAGVVAGCEWFERCFTELDPDVDIFWHHKDGDRVIAGSQLCEISGSARAMLTAERSGLNFLQLLSAVATKTRTFVDLVRGTSARILDTRKTLPGLRLAQKYAVRVGGGHNHRIGLYDGILIKENHIAAAGGIAPALKAAFALVQHQAPRETLIEVEVESLDQLREALQCGAKLILLDNMDNATMTEAVTLSRSHSGVELEASGGVNLKTVRAIAETGVHRISVGSLTKDIDAMDLSMRFSMH
ncbi:MAG: carboxylating nicotinate-nucleotide diphosphorylase [Betaproteobacteria bacterium]|nr:carboxylating nicotinate-nucleotide diphosphorylase [Betaproteobacteria bacterium]